MQFIVKGNTWSIEEVDKIPNTAGTACGFTDVKNRKLFILNSSSNFLCTVTFLHELLHVIGYEYNNKLLYGTKCDEALVDKVALLISSFIFVSLSKHSKDMLLLSKFIRTIFINQLGIEDFQILFAYTFIIYTKLVKGVLCNDKRN